jgi:hypothetical protein
VADIHFCKNKICKYKPPLCGGPYDPIRIGHGQKKKKKNVIHVAARHLCFIEANRNDSGSIVALLSVKLFAKWVALGSIPFIEAP